MTLTITQKLEKFKTVYSPQNEDVLFLLDLVEKLTEENIHNRQLLYRVVNHIAETDKAFAVGLEATIR